jgi:hydroxymethylbilane synthase
MKTITVATRAGRLAMRQTEIVISELEKNFPEIDFPITKITTQGDTDRSTALWKTGGTGFFTGKIEQALLENRADIAVHSFKDLPTKSPPQLEISAICSRQFPQDCLVTSDNIKSLQQLKTTPVIGTSSLRRNVQFRKIRPDAKIESIRGNIPRRLELAEGKNLDGVLIAYAALCRLELENKAAVVFSPADFVPAPAQGALAVQTRKKDADIAKIVSTIDSPQARLCTMAERQILVSTGCGCHAPVGAFAKTEKNDIIITAFISDLSTENFIRETLTGKKNQAVDTARMLADKILEKGGADILDKLENEKHETK